MLVILCAGVAFIAICCLIVLQVVNLRKKRTLEYLTKGPSFQLESLKWKEIRESSIADASELLIGITVVFLIFAFILTIVNIPLHEKLDFKNAYEYTETRFIREFDKIETTGKTVKIHLIEPYGNQEYVEVDVINSNLSITGGYDEPAALGIVLVVEKKNIQLNPKSLSFWFGYPNFYEKENLEKIKAYVVFY